MGLQIRADSDVPRAAEVALQGEGGIAGHDELVVVLNHHNIRVNLAVLKER
jgi:hypothetical protein